MQRREFLKKTAVAGVVIAGSPSVLLMEGCSVDIKALLNTVLNSAEAILRVAAPGEPWIQPLENAIAALQQAEQQWSASGTVQILISALNTVQAVLAVIPVTAPYSALIAVLVAGIEAVLTALVPQPAPSPATQNAAHNPYLGAYRTPLNKPHVFQSYQGAYKNQWNKTAIKANLKAACI